MIMKKIVLLFLALLPVFVYAQKIDKSIIDDFTGSKVIYTSWETLNTGNFMDANNHMFFRFRYENNTIYFHLKWITRDILSVDKGAKIIFKFNNDSLCTLHSLSYTISERGGGSIGLSMSALWGLDLIYVGDEMNSFLMDHFVTKFRIYTNSGYVDIDIKEGNAVKINKAYSLLEDEIKK